MGVVRFDRIAKECRETHKGGFEGIPIVGLEHIEPYELRLKNYDINIETTFTKRFHEGQILFGRRRAYQHKACVATFDGICSGDITVIEPIEGQVYPGLLPFIIQNDDFFEHAIKGSNGALSPRVKWEHMANYEVNLPSFAEQKHLAEKLWAAYEVKQSYLKMIKATQEMVQSQFIEMFYSNNNYEKISLTSVSDFQGGSQPPKKEWISNPAPGYIRMLQIRDFTQSEKDNVEYVKISNSIKTCEESDILIGRYGASVGKILTGLSGAYNVAIMKTIPNTDIINRVYFKYFLLSNYFQKNIIRVGNGRGAQAGFNKEDLSNFIIPLPPMEEQNKFEMIYNQADKSISELRKSIDSIDIVIKSLINENLL